MMRAFAVSWALLSLLAISWSLATPIGAAPDEPAHLIKAASVVRGQLIGDRRADGEVVQVPDYIAYSYDQTCYAFKPDATADCMKDVPGDPSRLVDARTSAGLYNPLYYAAIGWPSLLFGDSSGIFAMRIVSGVVVSLFFALAFALISSWRRPVIPLLGLATAVTPMTLFLAGVVNPNSLEISATLAAFVGVLTIIREPDASRLASRSAIVLASASIAANMRGLSLLWLAIAVLSPFLSMKMGDVLALARRRPVTVAIAGTVVAVGAAAAWLLSTNSLVAAIEGSGPTAAVPGMGASPASGFIWTLTSTFDYAKGIVGVFGWLDTPAPNFVYALWSALAGGLLLCAAFLLRRREALVTIVLALAVILLPAALEAVYIKAGGEIWQGRYILPLFVCLVVAAAAGLSDQVNLSPRTASRMLFIVLSLWAAAQLGSFVAALKRYAVGTRSGWAELLHPRWNPPLGVPFTVGVYCLLLAATVLSVTLWWRALRARSSTHTPPQVAPPDSRWPYAL